MLSPEDVDPEIVANCLEAMENTAPDNYQAMELEDIARIVLASAMERIGRDLERAHDKARQRRGLAKELGQQLQAAEQALVLLHEGEQPPPADENVELSPAQMLWRWNRSTPADRLRVATYIRAESDRVDRMEAALRRIAERCPVRSERHRPVSFCSSEVARVALAGAEVTGG